VVVARWTDGTDSASDMDGRELGAPLSRMRKG